MRFRQPLVAVSSIGIVAFYAAYGYVWQHAGSSTDLSYPIGVIKVVGGMLATNFGAVVSKDRTHQRSESPKVESLSFKSTAAWAYVVALVLAMLFWGLNNFDAKYLDAIRALALTLPGVLAGALALEVKVRMSPPHKASQPPGIQ